MVLVLVAALTGACGGAECGDHVVGEGEECDSAADAPCETECGSRGVVHCDPVTCRRSACEAPAELCNASDDDCDGRVDEGFECTAGATVECTTACGTVGRRRCEETCALGACEPPAEVCDNGVDDDCDGVVDRFGMLGDELVLAERGARLPEMILAGGEHVVEWVERGERGDRLRTLRVSAGGEPRGTPASIEASSVTGHALAAVGEAVVVAYADPIERSVFTARVGPAGEGAYRVRRFEPDRGLAHQGTLASTGRAIGLALTAVSGGINSVYFAVGDGAARRVSRGQHGATNPAVVWDGSGFAVAWSDERHGAVGWEGNGFVGNSEIYFTRIPEDGVPVGDEVRITDTDGLSDGALLAWNGRVLGLAWWELRGGRSSAHFTTLHPDGTRAGPDRVLSRDANAHPVALAWSGTEWGVGWAAGPLGREQLHFARLSEAGERIGEATLVTPRPLVSPQARLVWNGASWSWVWWETEPEQAPSGAIHFARLGCE